MTIRQRITIFNPLDTNEDVIESVNGTLLKLDSREYQVEERYIIPGRAYEIPCDLNIQLNDFENSEFLFKRYLRGLNVYLKPTNRDYDVCWNQIEKLLEATFGASDKNFVKAFDSFYYYLDSLENVKFILFIQDLVSDQTIVDFSKEVSVQYLSSTSQNQTTVVLSGYSRTNSQIGIKQGFKKEIGIFIVEDKVSDREDLVLSGIRIVLDPLESPSTNEDFMHKTLFHIKPRHRLLNSTYSAEIKAKGLHPILSTQINETEVPQDSDVKTCSLYYYLDLKKSAFIDKYQIPRPFKILHYYGNTDLELPEYRVDDWGSEILMEIEPHKTIDLPLHSRYHAPQLNLPYSTIDINRPLVFYACDVREPKVLNANPFDYRRQGSGNYERFFDDGVVFYHLNADHGELKVSIPVASDQSIIYVITNGVVILGIVYILIRIFRLVKNRTKAKKE